MRDYLRNPVLPIGALYRDTIYTMDAQTDFIHIIFVNQGQWQVSGKFLSFTPDSSLIGKDSIQFRISDGFQEDSILHTWHYEVVDTMPIDSVKFSPDLGGQLPVWMIAGEDSMSCKLTVITGTPPFRFKAQIITLDTIILDSVTIDSFTWVPEPADTGTHILKCTVTDSLHTQDLFIHSFTVLPLNNDPVTLEYIVKPATLLSGDSIDLGNYDTALAIFTVKDNDNPLTETHTVTITSSDGISTFTLDSLNDSLQFTLTIEPEKNKEDEQILVQVVDSDGNKAQQILNVIYPKYYEPHEIANLKYWFNASDDTTLLDNSGNQCGNGDFVATWQNKATGGNPFIQSIQSLCPQYTVGSVSSVSFQSAEKSNMYINDEGNWISDLFQVFIVAKLTGNIQDSLYTLLSSSSFTKSFNLGVIHGNVGVYSTDETGENISCSNMLSVLEDSLYIFTYFVTSHRTDFTVGLNGKLDNTLPPLKTNVNNRLLVGSYQTGAIHDTWEGNIAEIIFYSAPMENKYYHGLMQYLSRKYSITLFNK